MRFSLVKSTIFLILYLILIFSSSIPNNQLIQIGIANNLQQANYINNWLFITCHLILICCGLLLFKERFKQSWKGYKQNFWQYLGFAILGMLGIIFVSSLFNFNTANQNSLWLMMSQMTSLQKIFFIVVLTFIGPINEELVFRQILIGEFSQYLSKWLLLIISSFLFGILHIPSLNLFYQTLPYLGSGLILGLVYIKSKDNVLCSASVHWLNNLLSLILK